MDAVVAVCSDWGIGKDGTQPVVVPEDRARFREITGSGTVIVGRKTLADFPGGKPLKNRRNIVITTGDAPIEGAMLAHSPEEAAALTGDGPAFVVGGGSVYAALIDRCERAYVTVIDACPESDAFFPDLDARPGWVCAEPGEWRESGGVRYRFAVYENRGVVELNP